MYFLLKNLHHFFLHRFDWNGRTLCDTSNSDLLSGPISKDIKLKDELSGIEKAKVVVEDKALPKILESGLSVYLSVQPNIQDSLHELNELVKSTWETETIRLVDSA